MRSSYRIDIALTLLFVPRQYHPGGHHLFGAKRLWQATLGTALLGCMFISLICTAVLASSDQPVSWDIDDGSMKAKLILPEADVELASIAICEINVLASSKIEYEIGIPESDWGDQGIELVDKAPVLIEEGDRKSAPDVWQVQVIPLEAGTSEISGPVITYWQSDSSVSEAATPVVRLELPSSTLTVVNPLEDTDDTQLSRMKDPLAAKTDYSRLLTVLLYAAGVVILAAAIVWIIRRLRYIRSQELTTTSRPRAAHEIAYERLKNIEESGLIEQGRCREFHFAISACLREYLENRFGIPALEMTTEEFLEHSQTREYLPQACRTRVVELLSLSDLVKFAKRDSLIDEMRHVLTSVRRLIDETLNKDDTQEDEVVKQ